MHRYRNRSSRPLEGSLLPYCGHLNSDLNAYNVGEEPSTASFAASLSIRQNWLPHPPATRSSLRPALSRVSGSLDSKPTTSALQDSVRYRGFCLCHEVSLRPHQPPSPQHATSQVRPSDRRRPVAGKSDANPGRVSAGSNQGQARTDATTAGVVLRRDVAA